MSEGFAQGPYVAARAGLEPVTLRKQITELTTEPPRPRCEEEAEEPDADGDDIGGGTEIMRASIGGLFHT